MESKWVAGDDIRKARNDNEVSEYDNNNESSAIQTQGGITNNQIYKSSLW